MGMGFNPANAIGSVVGGVGAGLSGILGGGVAKVDTPAPIAAPAVPAAAAPTTSASPAIAAVAANQRAKASAAMATNGANPDLDGAPQTAKSNLLGPS